MGQLEGLMRGGVRQRSLAHQATYLALVGEPNHGKSNAVNAPSVAQACGQLLWRTGSAEKTIEVADMRYTANITAGALKLPESRQIADLLLRGVDAKGWKDAIVTENVLKVRNAATARRLTKLIRGRLETMRPELWK